MARAWSYSVMFSAVCGKAWRNAPVRPVIASVNPSSPPNSLQTTAMEQGDFARRRMSTIRLLDLRATFGNEDVPEFRPASF